MNKFLFSRVDEDRVELLGPDRACAEWLLRNGARIKWKNSVEYLENYNNLPSLDKKYHIQAVDATDSAIHHIGFPHFGKIQVFRKSKIYEFAYFKNFKNVCKMYVNMLHFSHYF